MSPTDEFPRKPRDAQDGPAVGVTPSVRSGQAECHEPEHGDDRGRDIPKRLEHDTA